jgi:hypothetical protein
VFGSKVTFVGEVVRDRLLDRVEVDAADRDRDELAAGGDYRVAHRLGRRILAGAGDQPGAELTTTDDECVVHVRSA